MEPIKDLAQLEAMLLEGLESGPGITVGTPEWDEFWKTIERRIEEQQRKNQS